MLALVRKNTSSARKSADFALCKLKCFLSFQSALGLISVYLLSNVNFAKKNCFVRYRFGAKLEIFEKILKCIIKI